MISVGSISLGNSVGFLSMIIKPIEGFPNKKKICFCRDFVPNVLFQMHIANSPNYMSMQRWCAVSHKGLSSSAKLLKNLFGF